MSDSLQVRVRVRLFAIARERAGIAELALTLPMGATVAAARDALVEKCPQLANLIPRVAYAVNQTYAPLEAVLHEGDEVAIIPPVSGG